MWLMCDYRQLQPATVDRRRQSLALVLPVHLQAFRPCRDNGTGSTLSKPTASLSPFASCFCSLTFVLFSLNICVDLEHDVGGARRARVSFHRRDRLVDLYAQKLRIALRVRWRSLRRRNEAF
jgi:hypothetical protein